MPTYIGLRVMRYTPRVTSWLARAGLKGLTVVLKRQNSYSPARSKPSPIARAGSAIQCTHDGQTSASAPASGSHHIRAATSKATTGGGTRLLRNDMDRRTKVEWSCMLAHKGMPLPASG